MKYIPDFEFTPFEQGKCEDQMCKSERIRSVTRMMIAVQESVDWFVANYDTCRK